MSTDVLRSISPQDPTDVVTERAVASDAALADVFAGAWEAQRMWWAGGAAARAAALSAAAAALSARRSDAIELVVREVGKPLVEATGEVARSVAILNYYAQACFAATGAQLPPSAKGLLYSDRRPHGVAGLITPWNFPLAIPLWKAAPALAAGNAVVLKPSPDAMACADMLAELFAPLLPEGLFSVVHGAGPTGEAVVARADVVSFTGSAKVGAAVASAAVSRGVVVQCEMGGQNAAIVLPDADPFSTAAMIAGAAMGYAGQKCTATRRVIVVGPNDAFVEQLGEAVADLRVGDPADAATVVGPVINEPAHSKLTAAFESARNDGGKVLAGGHLLDRRGWFVEPTLVAGLSPDHELAQEETFGPLALVLHADDVAHAVEISNAVRFGLVTSVHGRDLDAVLSAVRDIDTGLIKINAPTAGVDFYAPFGGEKDSSIGQREQGTAALDFYSSPRTVTIAPHAPSS